MLTEKRFTSGEVTINYAEGPAAGPPLLLLHGLSDPCPACIPISYLLLLQLEDSFFGKMELPFYLSDPALYFQEDFIHFFLPV